MSKFRNIQDEFSMGELYDLNIILTKKNAREET